MLAQSRLGSSGCQSRRTPSCQSQKGAKARFQARRVSAPSVLASSPSCSGSINRSPSVLKYSLFRSPPCQPLASQAMTVPSSLSRASSWSTMTRVKRGSFLFMARVGEVAVSVMLPARSVINVFMSGALHDLCHVCRACPVSVYLAWKGWCCHQRRALPGTCLPPCDKAGGSDRPSDRGHRRAPGS